MNALREPGSLPRPVKLSAIESYVEGTTPLRYGHKAGMIIEIGSPVRIALAEACHVHLAGRAGQNAVHREVLLQTSIGGSVEEVVAVEVDGWDRVEPGDPAEEPGLGRVEVALIHARRRD